MRRNPAAIKAIVDTGTAGIILPRRMAAKSTHNSIRLQSAMMQMGHIVLAAKQKLQLSGSYSGGNFSSSMKRI